MSHHWSPMHSRIVINYQYQLPAKNLQRTMLRHFDAKSARFCGLVTAPVEAYALSWLPYRPLTQSSAHQPQLLSFPEGLVGSTICVQFGIGAYLLA
jgi:hypothetical protein